MKRTFLLIAALLPAACGIAGAQNLRLLVGTYTEGSGSEGLYLYSYDVRNAATTLLDSAPSGNPSFVILNEDATRAYSVNEFSDGREGVSSFVIEGNTIRPESEAPIAGAAVKGGDPCNILMTGDALLTSNYTGGSVSVFSLDGSGRIGEMTQYFDSPASHMHCAVTSPDGEYIFVTDLGGDRILRFRRTAYPWSPLGESVVAWQGNASLRYGPRHLVFSKDGRFAYLLCELSDRLLCFSYSGGDLTPVQDIVAYRGKGGGSADIHLSPDGRFLYTSHRLKKDGISVFSIDSASGQVKYAAFQKTGKHPRNFAVSPDGRFLLCACRDEGRIEIYGIDKGSGRLSPTGRSIKVPAPVCVQFIE